MQCPNLTRINEFGYVEVGENAFVFLGMSAAGRLALVDEQEGGFMVRFVDVVPIESPQFDDGMDGRIMTIVDEETASRPYLGMVRTSTRR